MKHIQINIALQRTLSCYASYTSYYASCYVSLYDMIS